jgi:hypothetical protein
MGCLFHRGHPIAVDWISVVAIDNEALTNIFKCWLLFAMLQVRLAGDWDVHRYH